MSGGYQRYMYVSLGPGSAWAYDNVPTTVDPEQVFNACNRITDLETDLSNLQFAWQRELREYIDRRGLPSMSAGDRFTITDCLNNERIFDARCMASGWDIA